MLNILVPSSLFTMTTSLDFSSGTFKFLERVRVPYEDWVEEMREKVPKSPINLAVVGEKETSSFLINEF